MAQALLHRAEHLRELGLRQTAVLARAPDEAADPVEISSGHTDNDNSYVRFSANHGRVALTVRR